MAVYYQPATTLLQSEHSWLVVTFPSVLTPPPCAGFLLSAEDLLNGLCLVDMALEASGMEPGQKGSNNDMSLVWVRLSSSPYQHTWIRVRLRAEGGQVGVASCAGETSSRLLLVHSCVEVTHLTTSHTSHHTPYTTHHTHHTPHPIPHTPHHTHHTHHTPHHTRHSPHNRGSE